MNKVHFSNEKVPLSEQNKYVSLAKMTAPPMAYELITKIMV